VLEHPVGQIDDDGKEGEPEENSQDVPEQDDDQDRKYDQYHVPAGFAYIAGVTSNLAGHEITLESCIIIVLLVRACPLGSRRYAVC